MSHRLNINQLQAYMNQQISQQQAQLQNQIINQSQNQLNQEDCLNAISEFITQSLNKIPKSSSPQDVAITIAQAISNFNPSSAQQAFLNSLSLKEQLNIGSGAAGIALGYFVKTNNIKNPNTFINQVSQIIQEAMTMIESESNSTTTSPSPSSTNSPTTSPTNSPTTSPSHSSTNSPTPSPSTSAHKTNIIATSIVHAQKKSHHILIIAIIVAVCIALGLVGFFVYRHTHKNTRRRF
jgi:hypothetical protein